MSLPVISYFTKISIGNQPLTVAPTQPFKVGGTTYSGVIILNSTPTDFLVDQTATYHRIKTGQNMYLTLLQNTSYLPADVKRLIGTSQYFFSAGNIESRYYFTSDQSPTNQSDVDLTNETSQFYINLAGSSYFISTNNSILTADTIGQQATVNQVTAANDYTTNGEPVPTDRFGNPILITETPPTLFQGHLSGMPVDDPTAGMPNLSKLQIKQLRREFFGGGGGGGGTADFTAAIIGPILGAVGIPAPGLLMPGFGRVNTFMTTNNVKSTSGIFGAAKLFSTETSLAEQAIIKNDISQRNVSNDAVFTPPIAQLITPITTALVNACITITDNCKYFAISGAASDGSANAAIYIYSLATVPQLIETITSSANQILGAALKFNTDGSVLAFSYIDFTLNFSEITIYTINPYTGRWGKQNHMPIPGVTTLGQNKNMMDMSKDGSTIIAATTNTVYFMDNTSVDGSWSDFYAINYGYPDQTITSVCISPDGTYAFVAIISEVSYIDRYQRIGAGNWIRMTVEMTPSYLIASPIVYMKTNYNGVNLYFTFGNSEIPYNVSGYMFNNVMNVVLGGAHIAVSSVCVNSSMSSIMVVGSNIHPVGNQGFLQPSFEPFEKAFTENKVEHADPPSDNVENMDANKTMPLKIGNNNIYSTGITGNQVRDLVQTINISGAVDAALADNNLSPVYIVLSNNGTVSICTNIVDPQNASTQITNFGATNTNFNYYCQIITNGDPNSAFISTRSPNDLGYGSISLDRVDQADKPGQTDKPGQIQPVKAEQSSQVEKSGQVQPVKADQSGQPIKTQSGRPFRNLYINGNIYVQGNFNQIMFASQAISLQLTDTSLTLTLTNPTSSGYWSLTGNVVTIVGTISWTGISQYALTNAPLIIRLTSSTNPGTGEINSVGQVAVSSGLNLTTYPLFCRLSGRSAISLFTYVTPNSSEYVFVGDNSGHPGSIAASGTITFSLTYTVIPNN